MNKAEKLLNSLATPKHMHDVCDTDVLFEIDPFDKTITSTGGQKSILVQDDHNSEIFTFKIPRYIEGHDMLLCDLVRIPYINSEVDTRNPRFATGVYTSTDLKVYEKDPDYLTFSWKISKNATVYPGTLAFMVVMLCMDGVHVLYRFGTDAYEDVYILERIDAELSFENEYIDVIEQWKESVKAEFTAYIDSETRIHADRMQEELSAEFNANMNAFSERVNDNLDVFDEILKTETTRMNSDISVLEARMNTFTALGEGSTTGDAELMDIRIGADGTVYADAGSAVREQVDNINRRNELLIGVGRSYLRGAFERGTMDGSGNKLASFCRVRSVNPLLYDRDITIAPKEGYRYNLLFRDELGVVTSETTWLSSTYVIPAYTRFDIVIARIAEDVSELVSVNEFVRVIEVSTLVSDLAEKVSDATDKFHYLSNVSPNLRTVVISDNLVDHSQCSDGYYYAYNNGLLTVRSDISTTGLVPCKPGQRYIPCVESSPRGGNCTFWNAYGQYVSGVDVTPNSNGFVVPDNPDIRYFRISFYTFEKNRYGIYIDEPKPFDDYAAIYELDKELRTPAFSTVEITYNVHRYVSSYQDDVSIVHGRNTKVGTSYQTVVVNKEKFDGTRTNVAIVGTSSSNPLGDNANTNVPAFSKNHNYLHVVNGGIYLVENGQADGITIIDGTILKSTGVEQFANEQYVLGITKDGQFKTYLNESADNIVADGCIHALTGFVPMIEDGIPVNDDVLSVCPHYNVRHPRQVIGVLSNGDYFTWCCDGRTDGENGMTLAECIETMTEDLDISFAFNLDGGGSAQSVVGKKQINRVIDGRKIPNTVVFK